MFSAHLTNYADDGLPTEQHAAYYEARARGGAGLIITEEHSTHPTDHPYEKMIRGYDPAVVAGYRRITDGVHRHGAAVFAQINHNGPQGSGMYTRLPVWGPSAVPDPLFREVPKEIEPHEIAEIVEGYATVARHCVAGGFDGVELQCSHSSIVRSFLSPVANRRSDGYGGSPAARRRLLLELVAAVRTAIGSDRALGVRICGEELVPGGTTLDDAVEIARAVEAQGATDYVNTSIGVATASLFMIEASMRVPSGYALHIPAALRRAVALPVVGVGRFTQPQQAEHALEQGHCDLVGIVRGQIADPDFTLKASTGRSERIRACTACNQECVGRMGRNRWLGCLENPLAGRETTVVATADAAVHGPSPVRIRPAPKRVVVVGGGPAGLQAGVSAAEAGHRVTVLERDAEAGGQIRLAALAPGRAELGALVDNLVREAEVRGVELRLGVEASLGGIEELDPDVVVVATGAAATRPAWVSSDDSRVVDVTDVLAGRVVPTGRVVVVDGLGFHHATSVAELLAEAGATVTVTTDGMVVGQDLDVTLDLEHWLGRAALLGIRERTDLVPLGMVADGLSMLHHPTGEQLDVAADWVVLAVPARPADRLYHQLRTAALRPVHRIGDCVAPRRAHAAILEGQRVGRSL